ncbi:CAS1 [Symbiodinium sp. CCMP2456]|nr:CAS1 [Symbiodinium sp. CCMP2456]
MPWLNDALGKVREQSSSLVATAKEQVKQRILGSDGDEQLEAQARAAAGGAVGAVDQLCQAWCRQLGTASLSSDVGLARDVFWQSLLRCHAAEELLKSVGQQTGSQQTGVPDSRSVRLLVARVLPDDHAALGQELVTLLSGERGDLSTEQHSNFAAKLLSAGKVDWRTEADFAQRSELNRMAEQRTKELQQLGSAPSDLDRSTRRVRASAELLGLCDAIHQSLLEAQSQVAASAQERSQQLQSILHDIEVYASSFSQGEGVGQRQQRLQQELREAHDSLAKDLAVVDEKRASSDAQIESLETKKLQLRQQLHAVDEKLHAAREGQRSWLAQKDRHRRAVEDVEATFRKNLKEIEEQGLAARKERAAAEKVKEAAAETEVLAVRALSGASEDLSSKAAQFDSHLLNVLLEHLGLEERRIQLLDHESNRCAEIMKKHQAEIDLMSVMDRPLNSVLDAAEHRHLCQTSLAAEAALKACAAFARDFGPFLSKQPEAPARLRKLEADHAEVIRKLAPCRALPGVSSAQSPQQQAPLQLPQQSPKQLPQQPPQQPQPQQPPPDPRPKPASQSPHRQQQEAAQPAQKEPPAQRSQQEQLHQDQSDEQPAAAQPQESQISGQGEQLPARHAQPLQENKSPSELGAEQPPPAADTIGGTVRTAAPESVEGDTGPAP